MSDFVVLVCGGRDYDDRGFLYSQLTALNDTRRITMIIHGGAPGADYLADLWAKQTGTPCTSYPAAWKTLGRRAGPQRNQRMLDEGKPDACLAFPTKNSTGTWDMVRRAKNAGIPTQVFEK